MILIIKTFFTSSKNFIINALDFDNFSDTTVELIKPLKDDDDNLLRSNEYSLLGQKKQKPSNISKAKYTLGITIYNKVKSILNCEKFELCKECYSLQENKYFYILYKKEKNQNKIYYVMYIKNRVEKIQIIENNKDSKNEEEQNISEKDLWGIKFKCFKIIKKGEK